MLQERNQPYTSHPIFLMVLVSIMLARIGPAASLIPQSCSSPFVSFARPASLRFHPSLPRCTGHSRSRSQSISLRRALFSTKPSPPLPHKIYIITGPTGVGKSSFASSLNPPFVISADSVQIYSHLTVGANKPTPTEIRNWGGVRHELIGTTPLSKGDSSEENTSAAGWLVSKNEGSWDLLSRILSNLVRTHTSTNPSLPPPPPPSPIRKTQPP